MNSFLLLLLFFFFNALAPEALQTQEETALPGLANF